MRKNMPFNDILRLIKSGQSIAVVKSQAAVYALVNKKTVTTRAMVLVDPKNPENSKRVTLITKI